MKHLDLFSGIGGFAIAANIVWGTDYDPVAFCDNDEYCQNLIKIRYPDVKIYDDIKKIKGKRIRASLITGGFPCQPFSKAGRRLGTKDARNLWPEMLGIIRDVQPPWSKRNEKT